MIESSNINRKRGRKYDNNLDEYLQKFWIKGALAKFNHGQNIFNAYFELGEEAQSDTFIDLTELVYLIQKYRHRGRLKESTLSLD
ncbi:MAG: hypothetical protein CMB82_11355 [Flammeovirgaceae bacterium]|nr:hypothetical protein [Flammeovirgaceae bacterium]